MIEPLNSGSKTVTVSRAWYESALLTLRVEGLSSCPFCDSRRPYVMEADDELFQGRRGCTVCNRWWEAKELKKP